MTSVHTGSRLHFGLFDLKQFGGVGMMIDKPCVEVIAERADQWSVTGPMSERTQFVIDRLVKRFRDLPPMRVAVVEGPPEHAGFGSGTQTSLALATAIVTEANCDVSTIALAQLLDRGQRSAIGIHGFTHGGLLMDSGKLNDDAVSSLSLRIQLPSTWQVLLITPNEPESWSGLRERDAFALLKERDAPCHDLDLRRLADCELLPAARAGDLNAFGAALTEFNAKAGDSFAPVQGGRYASPRITTIVNELISLGLTGVGQSSWGPAVFTFGIDTERLEHIGQSFAANGATVRITRPRNAGAEITRNNQPT